MSRQVRYRVAALTLGGLLLGAPPLLNGSAQAGGEEGGRVEGGGQQVAFTRRGGPRLPCRSTPEVESVTVPAGSTIRLVNRTGHSADLRLGENRKGTLGDDGTADVVFRSGTTAVAM